MILMHNEALSPSIQAPEVCGAPRMSDRTDLGKKT